MQRGAYDNNLQAITPGIRYACILPIDSDLIYKSPKQVKEGTKYYLSPLCGFAKKIEKRCYIHYMSYT